MFRYECCGKTSKAGEKQNRVVITKRPREYSLEKDGHPGTGWEIAKEQTVCAAHDPSKKTSE